MARRFIIFPHGRLPEGSNATGFSRLLPFVSSSLNPSAGCRRPLESLRGLSRIPTLALQQELPKVSVCDVIQVILMQIAYTSPAHADGGQSVNQVKGQSVWCHESPIEGFKLPTLVSILRPIVRPNYRVRVRDDVVRVAANGSGD
jgi:hypothetical protein